MKALVRSGDRISLGYDQQQRDKYGRLLAFVWLADGRMLNEVIICEGYAPALTHYPFRRDYQERFRTCAQTARAAGKGLWATESASVASPTPVSRGEEKAVTGRGNRRNQVYHLPTCPAYDTLSPKNIISFASEEEARRAGYRKAGNCLGSSPRFSRPIIVPVHLPTNWRHYLFTYSSEEMRRVIL